MALRTIRKSRPLNLALWTERVRRTQRRVKQTLPFSPTVRHSFPFLSRSRVHFFGPLQDHVPANHDVENNEPTDDAKEKEN